MASVVLRRSFLNASRSRTFHSSARALVKVGDAIPKINLVEGSPGNHVDLSEAIKGKALIIGVPGAFSPGCSQSHIPGYLNHKNIKSAGEVFVVTVNDAFVTKSWGEALDPKGTSGFRFLGDPEAKFTEALDLGFDATAIFGNIRSKRYALEIEGGKVKKAHVEPDNTSVNVSSAEKVLG